MSTPTVRQWPPDLDAAPPAVRRFFQAPRAEQIATLIALHDALALLYGFQTNTTAQLAEIVERLGVDGHGLQQGRPLSELRRALGR